MTRLGDLVESVKPGFACGAEDHAGIFQVRMNNVTRSGSLDLLKRRRVPRDAHRRIESFALNPGDVLVNITNSPSNVGKSAVFSGVGEPTVFSNHFLRVRVDQSLLVPNYLHQWLMMQFRLGVFEQLCRRWVNQSTVSREDLLNLEIDLPSLEEQRRIVSILGKSAEVNALRERLLGQFELLSQAMFAEHFGNPTKVMIRWPVGRLGDHLTFLTSGSRGWARYYAPSGDKFLRIQNVLRGEMSLDDLVYVNAPENAEARRTRVEQGDVLISITADLGRVAVVPRELGVAYINQHLSILRTSDVAPDYLAAFLSSPAGQRQILAKNREGVKAGLNFDDLNSLQIPLPPSGGQDWFARRVAIVEKLRDRARAALAAHHELAGVLQARLLSGEL